MQLRNTPRVSLNTYNAAYQFWEKAKPWRNDKRESAPRKVLKDQTKRSLAVYKDRDGNICFKYHYTDVVTWKPDDTCVLEVWTSMSTDTFADAFAPPSVRPWFMCPEAPAVGFAHGEEQHSKHGDYSWPEYRFFKVNRGSMTMARSEVSGLWSPQGDDFDPWETTTYDKVKARDALKAHGYADLRPWLGAYLGLQGHGMTTGLAQPREWVQAAEPMECVRDTSAIMSCLADRALWGAFGIVKRWAPTPDSERLYFRRYDWRADPQANQYKPRTHVENILKAVRLAVYAHDNLLTVVEKPYLLGYRGFRNWRKREADFA